MPLILDGRQGGSLRDVTDLRRMVADAGGLYSRAGLARRWNLSRTAVGNMTVESSFPSPVYVDGTKEVWLACEADAWRADRRP